jgi:hypothetical protein
MLDHDFCERASAVFGMLAQRGVNWWQWYIIWVSRRHIWCCFISKSISSQSSSSSSSSLAWLSIIIITPIKHPLEVGSSCATLDVSYYPQSKTAFIVSFSLENIALSQFQSPGNRCSVSGEYWERKSKLKTRRSC